LCGIVGVFIDLDHSEAYLQQGSKTELAPIGERAYHIPLLYVAIGICIYICTSICRLYVLVLRKKLVIPKWEK